MDGLAKSWGIVCLRHCDVFLWHLARTLAQREHPAHMADDALPCGWLSEWTEETTDEELQLKPSHDTHLPL